MTQHEKLLDKIRKLRAKAEDKSVSEAEAEAFAAKVQELLLEHGLTMMDVASGGEQPQTKLDGNEPLEFSEFASPSRRILLKNVCLYYMCDFVMWRKHKKIAIVGKPHNAEIALDMARYLVRTTIRLSNQYSPNQPDRIDFRKGCMARLSRRLQTMRQDREKQAKSSNPGNLPVLFVNESALVADYMAKITKSKTRAIKMGVHAVAGDRAGQTMSLTNQISGTATKPVRRLA